MDMQDSDEKPVNHGKSEKWIEAIKEAEKSFEKYHNRCDKLAKMYAASSAGESTEREFNIYWSNVEVLKPSVYARPPVPVVVPRFKDLKELPRKSSEMLERTLITSFELQDIDTTMKSIRNDYLLFGRGVPWLRYSAEGANDMEEANVEFSESVEVEHCSRRDFIHEVARKWSEVSWVGKRAHLDKKTFVARFGKKFSSVRAKKFEGMDGEKHGSPKVLVWEIWDKTTKRVIWVSPQSEKILDIQEPMLQLEGFFPCPRPAYGTLPEDSLIPVPDFMYYKDQVEEINEFTARISKLAEALKLKGFYAAGEGELKDAIEAALMENDNSATLVPVSNFAAFGGKSLSEAIVWLPFDQVAQIVQILIGLRKELIQDVYEITGISDIVRGASDPNETASAQKIKAQWGSVRIRERQGELARLARDTSRIMAEIMAENYQPETFEQMSQMDLPREEVIQQQVQQITAGAQQHIQAMQSQPPQQGQPQQDPNQIKQQVEQHIAKLNETITLEKIVKLFRNQRTRSFLIEIEVDSTIQPDEDAEKQRRTEFLTAIGGAISQMMPMVQAAPETGAFVAEALRFTVSGFRAGRQLEGVIEEMADKLKEAAKAPKQQGPSPEEIEAIVAKSVEGKRVEVESIKAKGATAKSELELLKIKREMNAPPEPKQAPKPEEHPEAIHQRQLAIEDHKHKNQKELKAMEYKAKGIEVNMDGQPTTLELLQPILTGLAQIMQQLGIQQQQMIETQQQVAASLNAPKRVVRDPETGEVMGVQPVLQSVK